MYAILFSLLFITSNGGQLSSDSPEALAREVENLEEAFANLGIRAAKSFLEPADDSTTSIQTDFQDLIERRNKLIQKILLRKVILNGVYTEVVDGRSPDILGIDVLRQFGMLNVGDVKLEGEKGDRISNKDMKKIVEGLSHPVELSTTPRTFEFYISSLVPLRNSMYREGDEWFKFFLAFSTAGLSIGGSLFTNQLSTLAFPILFGANVLAWTTVVRLLRAWVKTEDYTTKIHPYISNFYPLLVRLGLSSQEFWSPIGDEGFPTPFILKDQGRGVGSTVEIEELLVSSLENRKMDLDLIDHEPFSSIARDRLLQLYQMMRQQQIFPEVLIRTESDLHHSQISPRHALQRTGVAIGRIDDLFLKLEGWFYLTNANSRLPHASPTNLPDCRGPLASINKPD